MGNTVAEIEFVRVWERDGAWFQKAGCGFKW